MAGHSIEEIKKHQKKYIIVGLLLFFFTIITVVVAKIEIFKISKSENLSALDYLIGFAIASIKGTLVATIFMHLKGEKRLILITLAFTVIFFISLFILLLFAQSDPITTTHITIQTTKQTIL